MIRDPRESFAQAMSLSRYRKGKVGWSTARWLHSADLAQRNLSRYPHRYKVVRYETLMSHSENTLQEICAFLQESCTPAMIRAASLDRKGESGNTNECQFPAHAEKLAGNDRERITQRELAFTQDYTRRHLMRFGYPLEPAQLPLMERILFYLFDWPANRAGMAAWRALTAASLAEY